MLYSHAHSVGLSFETHATAMQHIVDVACRVSRSDNYSLGLNLVATGDDALDLAIADNKFVDSLFEVHLTTCGTNRIAHIGDDSR